MKRRSGTVGGDSVAGGRPTRLRWLSACAVTVGTCVIAALGVCFGSLAGRIDPRAVGSRPEASPVVVDPATVATAAATVHDWSVIAVVIGAILGCFAVWGAVTRLCARVIGGFLFGSR